ncbi:MAG: acetylornithine deacetylase/succinyl-diaminopimelate desuccinylase-like protein [Candidatus Latescibacterota bacterium]|jgi:acetylornithine deacetylase/succinyl-diaminopimelate desuccinylase-like protein
MDIDWAREGDEAVQRLQAMLRYDTTNPPGNELALAQFLAEELKTEGLEPQVLCSTDQRGNLIVRLRGDGSERPVLMMSHLDVVPAEPKMWTHPPFEGVVADDFVWGRGAIDSKLTGAVQLQVLLLCKRLGLPLKRDLVLVAAADEEKGGHLGMEWLVDQHPEWFDAEYGLNEAGGFALMVDEVPVYTCQVAEKGSAPYDVVAHGRPGHSSVPHNDNAIAHLGKALFNLGSGLMPHTVVPCVRAFFESMAKAMPRAHVGDLLRAVLVPETSEAALAALPVNEATRLMFQAMVRNTCAPTVLEAGLKRNVIPSEARAQLSGRPVPGVEQQDFEREVKALVSDGVNLDLTEPFRQGVAFAHESPLFDAIDLAMKQVDANSVVVPYMQTGGTDARFLCDLDMHVYGFVPMRYEAGLDFFDLCHGHDERVSTDNVTFAVQVLFDVVRRLNEG